MKGYQITFFTQQNRSHAGFPIAEWLVREAKKMNLEGATMVTAAEGLGRDHKIHAARFFELGDQPVAVTLAMSEDHLPILMARLNQEDLNLFYIKMPIEYGFTCSQTA